MVSSDALDKIHARLTRKSIEQEVLDDHDDDEDLDADAVVRIIDVAPNADSRELGSSLFPCQPITAALDNSSRTKQNPKTTLMAVTLPSWLMRYPNR